MLNLQKNLLRKNEAMGFVQMSQSKIEDLKK